MHILFVMVVVLRCTPKNIVYTERNQILLHVEIEYQTTTPYTVINFNRTV